MAPIRLGSLPLSNFALPIKSGLLDQTKRLLAELKVELVGELPAPVLHAASSVDVSNSRV